MTLAEIRRTLRDAIQANQLGQPVAIRWHLRLPAETQLEPLAADCLRDVEQLFESPIRNLGVSPLSQQVLTVLATCQNGQTAMVSVSATDANLAAHVLLIGTLGTVRLEGSELFELPTVIPDASLKDWSNCHHAGTERQ